MEYKKYFCHALFSCFWFCDYVFFISLYIDKISPIQVSILSYFNTIIAIILGWLILDEQISSKFIVATILIILGVFIINYKPEMFKTKRLKAD
ncbi:MULTISPECIES: EamA family transporter [Empedobacter]|uniref:EamA family transporter n=1 Tax=Empedobacter TaxID=59734 RepID=UPI0025BE459D|nr:MULTISPECIES: EamA family transporter [unclassified Empedobacter]